MADGFVVFFNFVCLKEQSCHKTMLKLKMEEVNVILSYSSYAFLC